MISCWRKSPFSPKWSVSESHIKREINEKLITCSERHLAKDPAGNQGNGHCNRSIIIIIIWKWLTFSPMWIEYEGNNKMRLQEAIVHKWNISNVSIILDCGFIYTKARRVHSCGLFHLEHGELVCIIIRPILLYFIPYKYIVCTGSLSGCSKLSKTVFMIQLATTLEMGALKS